MSSGSSATEAPPATAAGLQQAPTANRTFRLIQVLRAIAALMVVVHHSTIMLHDRNHLPVGNWTNGGAGVDIFFVISGFVMTISSTPLWRAAHPARTFLARRLERIVPMYWLVTTIKVLTVLAAPALALNALGTPWHVLASYLFLPNLGPQGSFEPIVVVGWTLNFEMAFYVLFALALATRTSLLKVVAPALMVLALLRLLPLSHMPVALQFYADPIVLEFLFGILLATALPYVRKLAWPLAALLLVAGFAGLLHWGWPIASRWRGLLWGPPALAIVAGALALEPRLGPHSPRWLLELGDASYSIYLIHGFALPAIGLLLARFGDHWPGAVPLSIFAMAVLSTAVGELVYRLIERPITHWFKGRRRTAIPANA